MAKLYFKYGAMGSSKSAQALITQFNYEELGMTVWLIKPSVDNRDGANIIRSRIGLQREAQVIRPEEDIAETFARAGHADVIIADEAQFFSPEQIDQLRRIVDEQNIPVLCFGLRTDFLTHFFPGARRLMELADSITEIKTVCACGRKATVNARIDARGRVITEGGQILLGGNDSYVAMCHKCWVDKIRAWLLVIWGHSCMPAVHSGAESGALLTVVQRLLPWMTDHILRKCAHFGEYALLGVFTAAALRTGTRFSWPAALPPGTLAALCDETIQLLVPGRSGQITDVWLDTAGYLTGALLTLLIFFLCRKRPKQRKTP